MYPTQITDYESVSTASWTSENLNLHPTSPTSGEEWAAYTYQHSVSDQSTDTDEVIMDPIRWAIDEPGSSGGDYDYEAWLAQQTGVLDTLLPSSGNSHVSDGAIPNLILPRMQPRYSNNNLTSTIRDLDLRCVKSLGATYDLAVNRVSRPRYFRIRLNGTAVGPLHDMEDLNDIYDWKLAKNYVPSSSPGAPPNGYFGGFRQGGQGPSPVPFADSILTYTLPDTVTFSAGDTLELDVWYEVRLRPCSISPEGVGGTNICYVLRHDTANSSRVEDSDKTPFFQGATWPLCTIMNREFSDGFDPDADTYSFNFGSNTWYPGDGSSGAQTADDGDGWIVNVTSRDLTWNGTVQSGTHAGKSAQIYLNWGAEIAYLKVTLFGVGSWHYRPQNSGDYPTWVAARRGRDINNQPTGCFTWDGTTTFEAWAGPNEDHPTLYSPSLDQPSSITVTHV